MDIEEALRIVDNVLGSKGLNNVQEYVFRQSWQNRSYAKMATETRYDETYLKYVGFKLWKLLSEVMQQEVTKSNLQAAVERYGRTLSHSIPSRLDDSLANPAELSLVSESLAEPLEQEPPETTHDLTSPVDAITIATLEKALSQSQQDWGEAMDVSQFYGRVEELTQLMQWVRQDGCRLVAVQGMGGIGKSSLSIKAGQQLAMERGGQRGKGVEQKSASSSVSSSPAFPPFTHIIWRSLRNAPPIETLLTDLIQFLSDQQETAATLPPDINGRIGRLLHYLRQSRCLVILDNLETVLQPGERVGQYRPGYEGYGELLRQVGELRHQSCLLITSREKPREIALAEGNQSSVRSLLLSGLNAHDGQAVVEQRRAFAAPDSDWQTLVQHYAGNPLALKIVAAAIEDLFDGNISTFLAYVQQQKTALVFDDIRDLLARQFDRLSDLEQEVMYWLAINREFVSLSELQSDLLGATAKQGLLEVLRSLGRRSLIETTSGNYTQQPVVMEYVTDTLISLMAAELITEKLSSFIRYALIKTTAKDYIRDSQLRLILQPIASQLQENFNTISLEQRFQSILERLHTQLGYSSGYAAGNLINLSNALRLNLVGYNFSNLNVWQADLQKINLHRVNFTNADLSRSVFIQMLGYVLSVSISPDGESIATGDGNGRVQLWRTSDGQPLGNLQQGQTSWIWSLAWHPTGTLLAQGNMDQTIQLWHPQTGECLNTLSGHENWVRTVAWSPDGKILASGSTDRTIKLWHPQTGTCLQTLQSEAVWSIAWSPDGTQLASVGIDQQIKIWDVHTGKQTHSFSGHTDLIRSVAWNPKRQILASAGNDKSIRLWNLQGDCLAILEGHQNAIWAVVWSPDGRHLSSASHDKTVRIWDGQTQQCVKTLTDHTNWVWSVDWSRNGKTVVSVSHDRTIKIWDVDTWNCQRTVAGYTSVVMSLTWSPDGQVLAGGCDDQVVRLWNAKTGTCFKTLYGHGNLVWGVAWNPNGNTIASSCDDQTVRIWDVLTGECRKILAHTSWVWAVAWHPNGTSLASCTQDYVILIWDGTSGQRLKVLEGHQNSVWIVAWSADGCLLASGSDDQTVRIWDVATGKCLQVLHHQAAVRSLSWHPTQPWLLTGGSDCLVRVWDAMGATCLKELPGHEQALWAVAWSPDGRTLASGGDDLAVRFWDAETGENLYTLPGHTSQIWSVAWHPDGQILASSSADQTIRLWDAQTGKFLQSLRADRPYEKMNITGVIGLTDAQRFSLQSLGAIEESISSS